MTAAPTRRRIGVAAVALAAGMSLAACGGADAGSDNSLGTVTPGTISFAFRSDDKPVSFVDNGKPTGFLIELTQAMAARMKLTPQYTATDFASMLPNVRNHKYDSAAFGTLATDARKQVTDFTTPVSFGEAKMVSRKAAELSTVDASAGKTVAITRGSELIPLLKQKVPTVTVKEFPNIAASANALTAGQVDGLFTGDATALDLVTKHPDYAYSPSITSGPTALPVAKDRPALKKALDDALKAVIADGTYTKLFDKWNPKGVPIPPDMITTYPGMQQRPGAVS
ncbi:substrate-binding periplasmic protein [Kutzneria sp. CA-103260]|uniref:substrate-binding periplasmic protein n=1 Tax=Kutzneria sp. CA-103260 TaxID=2802641 RepID=UPI001BA773FE|nr:transporter substrate-binding domain-containing protein [Kutzneria sp. CA-103260]QUQ63535.1 ABC transporter substrate-binding protein [Kutzneria sp. CA-103260]